MRYIMNAECCLDGGLAERERERFLEAFIAIQQGNALPITYSVSCSG